MEAIVVEGATKRFTLRHAHSIKEMTVRAARRQSLSERFTALDGIDLTVQEGESLALMGLNGSGKSTLLKLISGVMRPDDGSVRVRGRVAGLIEVGAGLHPDLTGRENIFLNAAILGMSKAETEAKYDAIVAFSEIEKFLDTQVKFYSSGMFMRLGFSVAVHTEPDVFLVDEVLAVGDPPFQKKCLDRIQELHAEGRTLVIVSHDMGTLEQVCGRGYVLSEGRPVYEGDIYGAVDLVAPPENELEATMRTRARRDAKALAAARVPTPAPPSCGGMPSNGAAFEASEDTAAFVAAELAGVPDLPDPVSALRYGLALADGEEGMALEFGVFSGRTLQVITAARDGKNVFGFDSFAGLPEDWRPGFPAGTFAVDEPPDVLGAELVIGLFEDTLPGFLDEHPEPVAFLHVDADLYSSAATVLHHVGPRLRPGSVIVFDEYFNYPGWREHEYRAWQEYADRTGVGYRYEARTRSDEQVVVRITSAPTEPREAASDAAPVPGAASDPGVRAGAESALGGERVTAEAATRTGHERPAGRAAPDEPAARAGRAAPDETPARTARAAPAERRGRGRLRELDLLRFVAALAVMAHHFTGVPQGSWNGDPRVIFPSLSVVTRFGHLGVNLFFLISGFVILMSAWGRTPGDFAISRVVRLFPAYWFGVVLSFVLFEIPGLVGAPLGARSRFLPNLTMLQEGVGAGSMELPYWTLWVEIHFYLLIALFVWRGVTYGRCVGVMAAWLFAGVLAQEGGSQLLKSVLIVDWAPYFIAGMAFFLIHRYGSNLVLWLLVGACWALAVYYSLRAVLPWQAWPGVHQYVFPAVITAIFGVMALVALHGLAWLSWRRLPALGALTYPLYLLHETVSRVVIKQLDWRMDPRGVLAIAVVSTLASAYLVYRFVERPVQRWLRAGLRHAAEQIRAS